MCKREKNQYGGKSQECNYPVAQHYSETYIHHFYKRMMGNADNFRGTVNDLGGGNSVGLENRVHWTCRIDSRL